MPVKLPKFQILFKNFLKEGETTIEAIQKANKEKIQTFDL